MHCRLISKLALVGLVLIRMVGASASWADADFKVTLLGTGSPVARHDRFGPSTLVEAGNQKLLFDAGRGATIRLRQLRIPISRLDVLFLTHFHSDHVVGIPDVWLSGWLPSGGQRKQPFRVIGPSGTQHMMSHLEQAYAADIKIRMEDEKHPKSGIEVAVQEFFEEGTVYQAEGVKVTAFAVNHGEAIKPAYGYRIDYAGRAVVLSGDTKFDPNVIRHAHGADLLIHEVAAARPELMDEPATKRVLAHHTSPREAGEVFRQAGPRLAVYTHIVLRSSPTVPEPTIEDLVAQTRETYSGPLEIGADLTVFEIGETVTVKHLQP